MFEHVSRNYPLISKEEQEILEKSTVAIAGVGGIGAWAAESLVRMGVGNIKLADLDEYEVHNLNRQAHSNSQNIGKEKVLEVESALYKINPKIKIESYTEGVNEDNIHSFLSGVDAVVDAVEYFEFPIRRLIQNESRKLGIATFLNVVGAFSVGLFIFDQTSMSFDDFIGYTNSDQKEDEFVMPFNRTIPVFPEYMIDYARKDLLKEIQARTVPITNLCAPVAIGAFWASNEIIIHLLKRRKLTVAPQCLVFDMYKNSCYSVDPVNEPLWTKKDLLERSVLEWD
jgi:Dinucleotide-utilizing enzymes involved in molybdopterin and thiamine biosynthesis family 1